MSKYWPLVVLFIVIVGCELDFKMKINEEDLSDSQGFSEFVVNRKVESQWLNWWRGAMKKNKEWVACGYGYTSGDTVFVSSTGKIEIKESDIASVAVYPAESCKEGRGAVAIIHPHLRKPDGAPINCEPSNGADFWFLRSQPDPIQDFHVMVVVCAAHKYAYTLLPIRETVIRYRWSQIGLPVPSRVDSIK